MNDTNKVLYDVDLLLEKLQEKNKIIAEDFLNENSTGYRVLSSPPPQILNDSKFAQFFQKLKKKLLNVYHICKNKLSGNKTQRSVHFQDYDEYGDHLREYNEDEYFDTFSEAQDFLPDPDKKLSFESYDENWKQITRNVLDSDLELLKGLVEYFKSEHSVGTKRYEHVGNLSKICFILNGNYHQVNSADATTSYSPIATSSNAKTNSNSNLS